MDLSGAKWEAGVGRPQFKCQLLDSLIQRAPTSAEPGLKTTYWMVSGASFMHEL